MADACRRAGVLESLAIQIDDIHRPHPLRVTIGEVDAAGKTILAGESVAPVERCGRLVIRVSMDGFHSPLLEW